MAERAGHRPVACVPVGGSVGREGTRCLVPAVRVGPGLGVAAAAPGRGARAPFEAGGACGAMTALAGGEVLLGREAMEGRAGGGEPHGSQRMRGRLGPMAQGVVEAVRRRARGCRRGRMAGGVGRRAGVVALGADRRVRDIRRGMVGARGVVPGLRRVRSRHPMAGRAGLDGSVGRSEARREVRPMAGLAGGQATAGRTLGQLGAQPMARAQGVAGEGVVVAGGGEAGGLAEGSARQLGAVADLAVIESRQGAARVARDPARRMDPAGSGPGEGGVGLAMACDGAGLGGGAVGATAEGNGLPGRALHGRSAQAGQVAKRATAAIHHAVALGAEQLG